VTVNGERYQDMDTKYLWTASHNIDTEGVHFRQDDTTCHTARATTITLLREKFEGRVLTRRGDQNWPHRSCDLTPLDFFLLGLRQR